MTQPKVHIFGDSVNRTEITSNGSIIFQGAAGFIHGEIYAYDSGATITIGIAGKANKVQITSFNANGVSNGMTPDHSQDHIIVDIPGVYLCSSSIHAESAGGGGADEFGFSVWKNNGATEFVNLHAHRQLSGGGGDTGSVSISGLVNLAFDDTIEVWCWNEDSTDNLVLDDITLSLIKIAGPT